jgi:hypothetical protein
MQRFNLEPQSPSTITEWYNTVEGIKGSLVTLADFHRLIAARYIAGYHENLTEFYVLGNWKFDSCGNCWQSQSDIKMQFPTIPAILTEDEFGKFIHANTTQKDPLQFDFVLSGLPQAHLICPICQKGWTIDDCIDSIEHKVDGEEQTIDLKDFIGKTIAEVNQISIQRTDGIFLLNQPEIMIRNDRFIDLTPDPAHEEHNTEHPDNVWVINKNGWVGEKDGIDSTYVIQEGDYGYFNIWKYYHKACNRKKMNELQLAQFERIFEKAGFKDLDVKFLATPNQYCPNGPDCCPSWYNVNTKYGTGILIGWRKRVININWSQWGYDFTYLFPDEDVTKWKGGIHAWSENKAIVYLYLIAKEIKGSNKIQNDILNFTMKEKE